MASSKDTGRSLRAKARRHYNEGEHQDDEIEGKRTWNLEEKLTSERFTNKWVKIMQGQEFTMKFLQEGGFDTPMLFKSTEDLGIKIPGKDFTVNDVKQHVGSRRQVDVMDVNTQKGVEMSMAQFAKYYENKERENLYNVISLEFSKTKLEDFVQAPSIVRQIDWVDIVWPRHLKKDQRDSTNTLAEMKYPKVQKYCLMSVAGCYTDFHVDFGGTSVWYHILHGKKVFWLIPPSEDNLELYENWVLSGKQSDIFLGDRVKECTKIVLEAGYTFMIPSGWIHAVYTPADSLVFGGNILHSFHIHRQLRVAQIEDRTHVPFKFRYPFFWEMNWFALERYVHTLTGKSFLAKAKVDKRKSLTSVEKSDEEASESQVIKKEKIDDETDGVDSKERLDGANSISDTSDVYESSHGVMGNAPKVQVKEENDVASPESDNTEEMDFHETETEIIVDKKPDPLTDFTNSGSSETMSNGDHKPNCLQRSLSKDGSCTSNSDTVKVKREPVNEGYSDRQCPEIKQERENDEGTSGDTSRKQHVHLCRHELIGLRVLHHQLENLPQGKRNVPELITDPDSLLQSAKEMLAEHLEDCQEGAVTGLPVLKCPKSNVTRVPKALKCKASLGYRPVGAKRLASGMRRRRTRCKKCDNCTSDDCRQCHYCKDMKKYGGPGRMKQSCVARQCLYPMLPHNALCVICTKEDRPGSSEVKGNPEVSSLMECHQCNEIVHPECLTEQKALEVDGVINEDLANSWECPKCVAKKDTQDENTEDITAIKKRKDSSSSGVKSQPKRGRPPLKSTEVKPSSLFSKSMTLRGIGGYSSALRFYRPGRGRGGTRQQLLAKQKVLQAKIHSMRGKKRRITQEARELRQSPLTTNPDNEENEENEQIVIKEEPKDRVDTILMEKRPASVKPKFIIRPLPGNQPPKYCPMIDGTNHKVERSIWLHMFRFLGHGDLCRCLCVCKTWNRWCYDASLWHTINLTQVPLNKYVMVGVVRRQPVCVDLSGCNITKLQLAWLIVRIPALRELYLARTPLQAVAALCSANCPQLLVLDLQWVCLKDSHLATLLSPIREHRPGLLDDCTKLHKLRELRLAGSDITDASMELLVEQTPYLVKLDLSYCGNITNHGLCALLIEESPLVHSLTELNVSGCHQLTDITLVSLAHCTRLRKVLALSCAHLTKDTWKAWAVDSNVQLIL
ncbi:lysine-specific demethylase 2B-like isoform X1 [Asterias rubens]|uniref:lysine-specific demethylase 2B-like isoform X1 n=1 Tax=Asterias rubens TaxID=7604 RepID=UPI0014555CB0|nr:lysine-specific demethylase 2B-like isoform X1 [Asterias rubens]